MKWETVETAPHETLLILGWWEGETFRQEVNSYSTGERWDDGFCTRSNMSFHGRATHWMPLLPPPPGE